MSNNLILSIFPGIDLLGMAFEEAGYCVVRGPDIVWGGDIKEFHPPAGVFAGIIGGPPCKGESALAHLNGRVGETLAPEFIRVVKEAKPDWWLMEAVIDHTAQSGNWHCFCGTDYITGGSPYGSPLCHASWCPGEYVYVLKLSPRWIGEKQSRVRYFHSNLNLEPHVDISIFEHPEYKYAVLANHGGKRGTIAHRQATYTWNEMLELQGLPVWFELPFFTKTGAREAVGNGVPLSMGRAVAKAVKNASK